MLAALELMRAAGTGHVVNVVSLAGIVAAPGEAVYTASKHAAIGFSLATLTDVRRAGVEGIHISCLCPDGMDADAVRQARGPGAEASFIGTMLLPADVAARVGELLDHPRPVAAMPAYRGALARVFDTFPRLRAAGHAAGARRRAREVAPHQEARVCGAVAAAVTSASRSLARSSPRASSSSPAHRGPCRAARRALW